MDSSTRERPCRYPPFVEEIGTTGRFVDTLGYRIFSKLGKPGTLCGIIIQKPSYELASVVSVSIIVYNVSSLLGLALRGCPEVRTKSSQNLRSLLVSRCLVVLLGKGLLVSGFTKLTLYHPTNPRNKC